jgi:hypothetical protein
VNRLLLPEDIPPELKDLTQWVCWRYEVRRRKRTKVPYQTCGRNADSTLPATWASFDAVWAGYLSSENTFDGVGFSFAESDPFTGVDLDGCVDANGVICEPARKIIERLNSYSEFSPSAAGIKIWVRGALPPRARHKTSKVEGFRCIEVYDRKRYFAVTGWHVPGTPRTIEHRQAELTALYEEWFPPPKPSQRKPAAASVGLNASDEDLIAKAMNAANGAKVRALWNGNTAGYGSGSEADLALCSMIAFYTGPDPDTIERIVRQSALARPKWDRADYLRNTISKAIENKMDFYTPPHSPSSPAPDSFRAPIERDSARIAFRPTPITAIGPSRPPDWVWEGYMARGYITLLTGLWKGGKSTLLAHLIRDLCRSSGLAEGLPQIKVLVVSEESPSIWTKRRDELALTEQLHLVCRPFKGRATADDWQELIRLIEASVKAEDYGLVILDTLAALWPVMDENNATDVLTALMPLVQITSARAALLLVHHPRKGDATEGQATRGSGALPGFVDVILELRRYAAQDPGDTRRVLTAYSRFDETPAETVLDLTGEGYVVLGDRASTKEAARRAAALELLPPEGPGKTPDEIHDEWPTGPKPGKRTVEKDLAALFAAGRCGRSGSGHKGDAFRYWKGSECVSRTHSSLRARNESEPPSPSPVSVKTGPAEAA